MTNSKRHGWVFILLFGVIHGHTALAEEQPPTLDNGEVALISAESEDGRVITYPAAFFDRYQPFTALDMIEQVPGYRLDDGTGVRGLGAAVGNVLISDRRVSAKQDRPSDILDRVPARHVDYIELIRGPVRGIELRGYSVLANVVLREDAPIAFGWETQARANLEHGPLATPRLALTMSHRWADIQYNAGIDIVRTNDGRRGYEELFIGGGDAVNEERFEYRDNVQEQIEASFTASTWRGETLYGLNARYFIQDADELLSRRHTSPGSDSALQEEFFDTDSDTRQFELGAEAERLLGDALLGKAIVLFNRRGEDSDTSRRSLDAQGSETQFRRARTKNVATEGIVRAEFDWTRWADHVVQLNVEVASNVLDNSLRQTVNGVSEPVPGANTRVEERRGDVVLQHLRPLGRFELEYGLGAEASTISQSGDAEQERSFFFLKPHAVLSHSPGEGQQTRLRIAREISQLDFNDFVSATVFEDDRLALGNPDLRPETTWIAEVSHERRFGALGVISATAFHHWISDVEDVLPLEFPHEAPGNIGDGRRWGVILETSTSLDAIITGARLRSRWRLQDSEVTDPVTGEKRVLSAVTGNAHDLPFRNENRYAFAVDFRQDLEAADIAWGWDVTQRAKRPNYQFNELDVYNEGTVANVFIETTRWFDLRMRLDVWNLLKWTDTRNRTVFSGERGSSDVAFREVRERKRAPRVIFSVQGTF